MAENKTKPENSSVGGFISKIKDSKVKQDCLTLIKLMESASKSAPVMWGPSIIGFGNHHYVYESGREGDICIIGFSPRKQNISLYLMGGASAFEDELQILGKHKTGKGCIYIKSLEDVNIAVLKRMIVKSIKISKQSKIK